MPIRCLQCNSNQVQEIVEENKVFYLCTQCHTKSGKALIIDSKIKVLNTSRGIKHFSVAAIILREDKILLTKRRTYPFGLELPFGHVEYNETSEEALVREVYEEIGVKVVSQTLFDQVEYDLPSCRYGGDIEEWSIYFIECEGEPFVNNNEAESLKWYPIDKIPVKELSLPTYITLQKTGHVLETNQEQAEVR